VKRANAAIAMVVTGVAFAAPAHAADYFVATTGNDSANGSAAAPFKTIRKAITVAMPGDTVRIRGGTYTGWSNQINPTRSGRADAWITFRADDGSLPIIEPTTDITGGSGFEPVDVAVSYIRVEGLVVRNWPTSGFSNGWNHPSSNIQVRYCIAENNGVNGITFYKASNVLFEYNIAAHNGNRAPSWSSGFNLFTATGSAQTNIVRGNVSFENVDICGDPAGGCDPMTSTDGNGFILDEQSTGALFANNIAFRNGGSCIRLTNSSGAHLINNTCFHDAQDTGYAFAQDEIFFSDDNSRNGAVVRNNVAAGISGIDGLNASGSATVQNNLWVGNNGATPFFTNPTGANPDFRPSASATQLINQGGATQAPTTDIGFDPRCIKQQSGALSFWQYAPDYAYITSIGGVAACFHPVARPQGSAPDIGAYESGATAGCSSATDCNDDDPCTMDTCGGTGQCNHSAVSGCCLTAADCNDNSVCTTDTCNTASGACEHTPTPGCCMATADCNDGNACTSDACNLATHQCAARPISRCCMSDAECTSPSACLLSACDTSISVCMTQPVAGCCALASDCDDGDACTTDACDSAGNCSNTAVAGCCLLDGDCADASACTTDTCDALTRRCVHAPLAGCCVSSADCDDGDPCTSDACAAGSGQCSNLPGSCGSGGSGGSTGGSNTGAASGSPAGGAPGAPDASNDGERDDSAACGCRTPGSGKPPSPLFALFVAVALGALRRKQKFFRSRSKATRRTPRGRLF
jgi:MYXO-CTERM domain-containing protein